MNIFSAAFEGVSARLVRHCRRAFVLLIVSFLVVGCSTNPLVAARKVATLQPLELPDRTITPAQARELAPTPDLLTLTDEMRDFVAQYTDGVYHPRQRLQVLHRAITGPASSGVEYQPFASGTAAQVFERGTANCLSYASLFVALGREAGLDAQYQWLEVKPQWTRQGERIMVRLHVNVAVKLRGREQFMVDIDPLQSRDIAGSRLISDRDAQALYHSNIAMQALADESIADAWVNAVRALQLSPSIAHLWVNIGAIYRHAGQHRAAEASYQQALAIDPWDRSAMNNLAVLYQIEGNAEQVAYWERRVARYRESNPFYYAWLGDKAGEEEDWNSAAEHYEKAVSMRPKDSSLLFALGVIHSRLGDNGTASGYIRDAIDNAKIYSDKKAYQQHLNTLEREAGLLPANST